MSFRRARNRDGDKGVRVDMLIGDVARLSGVSARMLRHYDTIGLVRPSQRLPSGYREYSEADLQRLLHVESLRTLGLSLGQVKEALNSPAFTPEQAIASVTAETEERIVRDRELLARLRAVANSSPHQWDDVLVVIRLLRGLASTVPAVRQRAALSVPTGSGSPSHALTTAALTEPVTDVAGALAWALAQGHGADMEALTAAMDSHDPQRRRRATHILTDLPLSDEVSSVLTRALDDLDPVVRADAAVHLGRHGHREAVPVLIHHVLEGKRDVDAADVLATLASDPADAERIVTRFATELTEGGHSASARIRCLQALHEIDLPEAVGVFRQLSDDADGDVARVARAFMAATHGREGDR